MPPSRRNLRRSRLRRQEDSNRITMEKSEIRKIIASRKRQHTEQELRELSLATVSRLMLSQQLQAAKTVLLYYSIHGEVDTHEMVETLYRQGKNVLLPRVKDEYSMDLVLYTGRDSLKPAGSFHILEPQGEPYTLYNNIDVAVIPGIAFTKNGKRMGRGRGYYDRLLPLLSKAYKIGICFPFQIFEDIPTDSHDFLMDEVIF